MIFEKSADTKVIESILEKCSVGELITYDQISKAIGRDVRGFAVTALRAARKSLLKDKAMVFGVEIDVGLKRLDDKGILDSTEDDRLRTRRLTKRSLLKLSVINYDKLSGEDKRTHTARSAQLGVIAMMSDRQSVKKIESKLKTTSGPIAIGETIKMFLE